MLHFYFSARIEFHLTCCTTLLTVDVFILHLPLTSELGLSTDSPVFRRGQALLPVPLLSRWLGPSDKLLVCPHEHLKPPPGQGTVHVVSGRYTYKHYLQDEVDDKGWGCAYRSLQTLISWLMWQGEVEAKRIPTLTEIQTSLVRLGDKSKAFIGSHQWIGSVEVSFCLQEMYNIQCRLLPVSRGAELSRTATTMLAHHFASGGGPVMIGGGQLAHTIIGVQVPKEPVLNSPNSKASTPRFLILDPHFTGPSGDLKVVLAKGWCGWKDQSFWRQDTYYNLCFLPAIQPGCV
ncbi:unnamed protein product [Dicrocoelium dendriticum]|nr:unnamed protein product [Dicrocoelium dendriticum]